MDRVKRLLKGLFKVILFVPAMIGTFLIVFLYAPRIPVLLLVSLMLLWGGSLLLAFNKTIGGGVGMMSPVLLLVMMQGEMMHVNPIPYAVVYMLFYVICGMIVFKSNRANKGAV